MNLYFLDAGISRTILTSVIAAVSNWKQVVTSW